MLWKVVYEYHNTSKLKQYVLQEAHLIVVGKMDNTIFEVHCFPTTSFHPHEAWAGSKPIVLVITETKIG